jgi:hypothetical protein
MLWACKKQTAHAQAQLLMHLLLRCVAAAWLLLSPGAV